MLTRKPNQFACRLAVFLCLAAVLMVSVAYACQVPVFRYALERWSADEYEVVVLHDGPLPESVVDFLDAFNGSQVSPAARANLRITDVDISSSKDRRLRDLWHSNGTEGQPLMAVFYPENAQEVPDRLVGTWPCSKQALQRLVDSPVRQSIAQKLLEGNSAVWIFVPSGDQQKDTAALKMLEQENLAAQKILKLPTAEEMETNELVVQEAKIKLKIDFSVVTLDRNDPAEEFVLNMLLDSESDLRTFDEPLAFPLFGRGRVLYALVGKGIAPHTIGTACSFIAGPCSCQVKGQNPGFDLLMSVDWDGAIGDKKISSPLPSAPSTPVLLTIPPGKSSSR